jgi:transcription termination factor Rho
MPTKPKVNDSKDIVDFNEIVDDSKTQKPETQSQAEQPAKDSEEKTITPPPISTVPSSSPQQTYSVSTPGATSNPHEENTYQRQEDSTYKVNGVLEIKGDYGVLRQDSSSNVQNLPKDVYVAATQINKFGLRKGDRVEGYARPPKEGERYLSLLRVEKVEGISATEARNRPRFEDLIPIHPNQRLKLETEPDILTTRLMDLLTPMGKGQRAMIVAPPKAGKTWLLQHIARGIAQNHPEIHLMVVLIGERPEEVTEMVRTVKGEVWASNFDESAVHQVEEAENSLERAKRLAEKGEDVCILMDSLTRLARAYNLVEPPSGRTLSGGFDPAALYPPKRFFGSARKFEDGGSLTIIATALIDTGSKMDDVIFEEFKGTGNMELFLDRTLAERRIYPAFDIKRSMTRHEELLYTAKEREKVVTLRRMMDLLDDKEATPIVIERLRKTKSNDEFLDTLSNGKI